MRIITEYTDYDKLQVINEEATIDGKKKDVFRLKGLMLEANTKNKNKRVYSKPILEREVNKVNEILKSGDSFPGTLDHDKTPQINLDRISHVVESLTMDGDQVIGTIRLLDNDMGDIAKKLIKENIKLGVSSRGVGTLTMKNKEGKVIKPDDKGKINEVPDIIEVNPDFSLLSIDLVKNPSLQKAMMESVTESTEWILNESGMYVEVKPNKFENVDKNWQSKQILNELNSFLDTIRKRG
jgi:hypothetical protein